MLLLIIMNTMVTATFIITLVNNVHCWRRLQHHQSLLPPPVVPWPPNDCCSCATCCSCSIDGKFGPQKFLPKINPPQLEWIKLNGTIKTDQLSWLNHSYSGNNKPLSSGSSGIPSLTDEVQLFIDPLPSPSPHNHHHHQHNFNHRFKPRPAQKPPAAFDELGPESSSNNNGGNRDHNVHGHRWPLHRPPYLTGGNRHQWHRPSLGPFATPFNYLNPFSRKELDHGNSKEITDDTSNESVVAGDPSDENFESWITGPAPGPVSLHLHLQHPRHQKWWRLHLSLPNLCYN